MVVRPPRQNLRKVGHSLAPSGVKSFDIKIASQSLPGWEAEFNFLEDHILTRRAILRFVRLLDQMQNLEELQLYQFNASSSILGNQSVLRVIASHLHWPHIRRCSLGGFYATEPSLMYFSITTPASKAWSWRVCDCDRNLGNYFQSPV